MKWFTTFLYLLLVDIIMASNIFPVFFIRLVLEKEMWMNIRTILGWKNYGGSWKGEKLNSCVPLYVMALLVHGSTKDSQLFLHLWVIHIRFQYPPLPFSRLVIVVSPTPPVPRQTYEDVGMFGACWLLGFSGGGWSGDNDDMYHIIMVFVMCTFSKYDFKRSLQKMHYFYILELYYRNLEWKSLRKSRKHFFVLLVQCKY